jgi:DNA-binding winged helix-turn-helix (wHTH) protein
LLRFGIFEADLRSGELRRNGAKVRLQGQPFQVLAILLDRPGVVVTREELREALWPQDTFVDFDHGLNTAINKLRGALGDSGTNPRFIETLARRGYRFIAPVTAAGAEGATQPTAAGGEVADELPRPQRALVRSLFVLAQIMYLALYVAALSHVAGVEREIAKVVPRQAFALAVAVMVVASAGIPLRFFQLFAVAFDYRSFARKFEKLFPALLVADELWALTPFLLADRIGLGLAFAAAAALLYLPFGQRTLVRMAY